MVENVNLDPTYIQYAPKKKEKKKLSRTLGSKRNNIPQDQLAGMLAWRLLHLLDWSNNPAPKK